MSHFVWNRNFCEAGIPVCDMREGPRADVPEICFIHSGDHSFSELNVDLSKIKHVFALNCDVRGPRVTGLPIGLDLHTVAAAGGWGEPKMTPEEQEAQLVEIFFESPDREPRIWADFQHSDTAHAGFNRAAQWGEDRKGIFDRLQKTGLLDYGPHMRRSDVWRTRCRYMFTVSPHGNGLDCHRTWEDLILGCIPIVKTSPIDYLYEGLPVAIVKDWDEVTADNLKAWRTRFGNLWNPEYRKRLTNEWWIAKIRKAIA